MTHALKHSGRTTVQRDLIGNPGQLLERLTHDIGSRLEADLTGKDKSKVIGIVMKALIDSLESINVEERRAPSNLPVSKLRASDVIAQERVNLSQASLYRAVEQGRFYCTTPSGRSIGKEFPAWQFVEPVPELIPFVLTFLANQPSSEIHAFWTTAADELNELAPAEVLAGVPFETRGKLHASQQRLLDLPTGQRREKVLVLAKASTRSMADIVG